MMVLCCEVVVDRGRDFRAAAPLAGVKSGAGDTEDGD